MKKFALFVSIFALPVFGVIAQDSLTLTHSYLDVGYERVFYSGDLGGSLEDANGIGLELSVAPTENFFLLGEYHFASPDIVAGSGSVDTQDLRLGLGVNTLMGGGAADIYLQGGARYVEIGSSGFFDRLDDWGFYVEPGVRVEIAPSLEVYLSGDYTRIDERNNWGGEVGTVFKFTDMLGLKLSGRIEEDRGILGIAGRLQW